MRVCFALDDSADGRATLNGRSVRCHLNYTRVQIVQRFQGSNSRQGCRNGLRNKPGAGVRTSESETAGRKLILCACFRVLQLTHSQNLHRLARYLSFITQEGTCFRHYQRTLGYFGGLSDLILGGIFERTPTLTRVLRGERK
jgi:hypothetical protein